MLKNLTLGCHGIPNRCFKINGIPMPFCARCLGAAIGHFFSLLYFLFCPLVPFWTPLIGLGIMFLDWYFQNNLRLYHSNITRLITGVMGGFSVGILIWSIIYFIYRLFY